jgi:1-deoxy-D-xylulose-5-phosphate synthase
VRFPRGAGVGVPLDPELKALPLGRAELLRDGEDAAILALGSMVHPALEAAAELASEGLAVAVLNARFAKPLDTERISGLARRCRALVTVEEHVALGGFGGAVLEALAAAGLAVPVSCLGVPDRIVEHGDPAELRADLGLDAAGIARAVREALAAARAAGR